MIKKIIPFILISLLSGCATTDSTTAKKVSQKNRKIVTHTWASQTAGIKLEKAYESNHELYLQYRAFIKDSDQSHVFYAKAFWDDEKNARINLVNSLAVPFDFIEKAQWQQSVESLSKLQNLEEYHYREFRKLFLQDITPQQKDFGVVVRGDDKSELFLYYDMDDQLQIIDIKDKPAEIKVKESLGPGEITARMVSILKQYLSDKKIQSRKVIFTTNDYEHTGLFVFIDLDKEVVLTLNLPEDEGERYKQSLIRKGIKSADQLIIKGHVFGLLSRPFSSTFRLMSWTKNTTYDVINPQKIRRIQNEGGAALNNGEPMDLDQFEKTLDQIVGNNVHDGEMNFLIDGDEFFPQFIDAIQNAKNKIYIRIFIFDNDDYAVKIADLLKEKAKDPNVEVKVLLDGMGTIMGEGKVPDNLPPGFIPPDSIVQYLKKDSNIEVRVRPNAWFKADHIKTIIIDDKMCFTGGMNIGREYRYDWHDMMVGLKGPVVAQTIKEFNDAWAHAGRWGDFEYLTKMVSPTKTKIEGDGYPIRLLFTRSNDSQIFKAQLAAIKEAKKYIYINNAYFSDNAILYELIRARGRGVDVRVILPVHGNHDIMNRSNMVTANIMLRNDIRVFFYPGMSHIKAAVYDGWLCTGSANFDKLSFRDNLELNIATSHKDTVETFLDELFTEDFKKSKEMTEQINTSLREYIAEFLAEQL